jgi:hypothetical protein
LAERSSYFETLISKGKVREHGRLAVELPDLSHTALEMLARWLYGQPLCVNKDDPEDDLDRLAELHKLACTAEEESGVRDSQLFDACINAIEQCLVQKSKELNDPIELLKNVLLANDKFPGKDAILRQLVYGECATDGRTMAWLEEFCDPNYNYDTEIVKMICLELAAKACAQSHKSGSTSSASTAN